MFTFEYEEYFNLETLDNPFGPSIVWIRQGLVLVVFMTALTLWPVEKLRTLKAEQKFFFFVQDIIPKRKNQAPSSSTQQPSPAAKDQTPDGVKSNKDVQEREEHDVLARIDASDEGSGEKEDLKESEVRWADPLRGTLKRGILDLG